MKAMATAMAMMATATAMATPIAAAATVAVTVADSQWPAATERARRARGQRLF
jgi:hypothetical protein